MYCRSALFVLTGTEFLISNAEHIDEMHYTDTYNFLVGSLKSNRRAPPMIPLTIFAASHPSDDRNAVIVNIAPVHFLLLASQTLQMIGTVRL